jgi:HD superfamily phosphodiesterase
MNPAVETHLRQCVEPLLKRGRKGDWDHTLRALNFGRYLLQREAADEDIVIPALYLHDIGWSQIDFSDFVQASPARKKDTASLALHMQHGAELADEILRKIGYDDSKRRLIFSIIAVHDEPDKVFAMKSLSASVVVEADRLDRFGPESLKRYQKMFGPDYMFGTHWQEAKTLRLEGLKSWFRTPTAKTLAQKLAREMGLFDWPD